MSDKDKKLQGWGFSQDGNNKQIQLKINNVAQQKINVWDQTNEELIFVPDLDEERQENANREVSQVQLQKVQQVKNFHELQRASRQFQLPKPDDNVDFTILMQFMRPYNEIFENDETWDFGTLKRETYEVVSSLYEVNNNSSQLN